jgi:hypothetical protein
LEATSPEKDQTAAGLQRERGTSEGDEERKREGDKEN